MVCINCMGPVATLLSTFGEHPIRQNFQAFIGI